MFSPHHYRLPPCPAGGDNPNAPSAYLNYVLFSSTYQRVDAGAVQVPQAAGFEEPQRGSGYGANNLVKFGSTIEVSQPGYLYVWVSNESENTEVWFDDLNVVHQTTIVSQATDYEVWGGVLREQMYDPDENYRFGYQGKYAEKDEETGWGHFELREYDAVIGRWTATDPYGQYYSPYVGMGNDPINGIDPDGGWGRKSPKIPNGGQPGGPFAWLKRLFGIGPKYVPESEAHKDFGKIDLEKTVFVLDEVAVTAKQEPVMEPQSGFWSLLSGNRTYTEDGRTVDVDDDGYGLGYKTVGGTVDVGGPLKGLQYLKNPNVLKHIFRNAPGHVNPQTVASQSRYLKLFKNVSSNKGNLVPTLNPQKAKAGVETFHKTFKNGKQVWVETIGGKINNAGVNVIPR